MKKTHRVNVTFSATEHRRVRLAMRKMHLASMAAAVRALSLKACAQGPKA